MNNIPIILLSAGASSRMGVSKALLEWNNETLIESRIKTLLGTNQEVVVVLGNQAKDIIPFIKDLNCQFIINENWEQGMSTSISCAVNYLLNSSQSIDAIVITTVDQPLVETSHLNSMIERFQKGQAPIIASESTQGWKGVPVLFDWTYAKELSALTGDLGAKTIVQHHRDRVITIKGGDQLIDMDTPKQYEELKKSSS